MLDIQNVTHRFTDGTVGISNINLTIKKGEFIVIVGHNGSGKTTLLRHLNGLLYPNQGKIILNGKSIAKDTKRARRMVGMVFQEVDSQIIGDTVYEDVAFGPENLGLDANLVNERVKNALIAMDMDHLEHKKTHLLSGGEKRRLAIAGILSMSTEIIVLDEPFSNLDFPSTTQLISYLNRLHKQGITVIIATHDIEKILDYTDRIIIMDQGRMVKFGFPQDMIQDLAAYGLIHQWSFQVAQFLKEERIGQVI
ncbi:MAG: ABC transporter ATP-binding protein [Desulfobacterales bacterium]|nr:ABC transporter ATP-binding protein [Desulfobacterales bacterium]